MTTLNSPANEPVDAVFIWFGSDPQFQLRYSLRSLARHAPWIRKVYLVTVGEPPKWIASGNPRVAVVPHEDLFRDKSVLPTLTPRALEWQLFRIPGLSRQFLYLDHDFFLGRPLERSDFQTVKGGLRFFVESAAIPADAPCHALLNSRFGQRAARKRPAQTPRFLDKSHLEEVHRLWEQAIKRQDVSLDLYFHYLVESPLQYGAHEQVEIDSDTFRLLAPASPGEAWKQLSPFSDSRPRFFRAGVKEDARDAGKTARAMRMLLWMHYWRKSPFEK